MQRLSWLLALTASACTCTPKPTIEPESVGSTTPSAAALARPSEIGPSDPSCGRENNVHGRGYDAAARTCLWEAWKKGTPADLVITLHTVEGDPITYALHVRDASTIEVKEDSRDRFGEPGVREATCTSMEKRTGNGDHFGFTLGGCTGRRPEMTIP